MIQVAGELSGFSFERAKAKAGQIFATTARIFASAEAEGIPHSVATDRLAEQRMSEVGRLRQLARHLTGRREGTKGQGQAPLVPH